MYHNCMIISIIASLSGCNISLRSTAQNPGQTPFHPSVSPEIVTKSSSPCLPPPPPPLSSSFFMDGPPLELLPSPIVDMSTARVAVATPCNPFSSSSSSEQGQFLGISPAVHVTSTAASPLPTHCPGKESHSKELAAEQEPVSPIPVATPAGRGVVTMATPGDMSVQSCRQATSTPNHQKQSE